MFLLLGGGLGFINGAIQGGASGFTGGFINSAGNAWLHDMSLGDGLVSGLKGGGIGALSGATIGGVSSGLEAKSKGLNFITGSKVTNLEKFGTALGIDVTASVNGADGATLANPTTGNSEEDFKQLLNAYRKASQITKSNGTLKIDDLFDMESIHNSPYWKRIDCKVTILQRSNYKWRKSKGYSKLEQSNYQ
ncbi:MAG: hypothetical protein LC664_11225 [Flavobacteriales bacterium]|nr:hypothetical protein [Flavobacteriales bacterium]